MEDIKIIIVDDHALFRSGIRSLIDNKQGCHVVAEYADGKEFIEAIGELEADIVFMDYSMPNINGEEATRIALVQKPSLRIICLSMFGEEQYYSRMVEAGAVGFLLKDSDINEVFEAIHTVYEGDSYFSPSLLNAISSKLKSENGDDSILSDREIDVLHGICQGLSNQEIAEKLFLSKRTVDAHRANILFKTNCKNTASLVVYALKNNLVKM